MLELKKLYFTIQNDDIDNGARRNIIDGIDFTFENCTYVEEADNNANKNSALI